MRQYDREQWQTVLNHAKCTIISKTSNDHFDSYVLSESSLFVYPNRVLLKTCGTTTLLKTVPHILTLAEKVEAKPDLLFFSRKNFNFPSRQPAPHTGFEAETAYLDQYFRGTAYTFGPRDGDHWHLYVADLAGENAERPPRLVLEVMMGRLDRKKMAQFYQGELNAKETTDATGISRLVPGSISDEKLFTPCGYSVNGLRDEAYYTIHVTPEPHCSFVSFETNVSLTNYTALMRQVLDTFHPGTVCFSLTAQRTYPTERLFDRDIPGYRLIEYTSKHVEGSFSVTFCSCEHVDLDSGSNNGATAPLSQ